MNKSVIKNMQRRQSEFNSDLNLPILIHREHSIKGKPLMGALSEVTLLVFHYLEKGLLSIVEGYSGLTHCYVNIQQF